ncbi:MAG: ABC transporter permease, partial [Nitrospinota bacterium]
MVQSSSSVITENPHLVKKVVFPLSILPIVKLLSSFATHLVFVALLAVMVFFHDLPFSLYWLQSGYYFFGMSILALGLSWIFAALHVFVRDIGQVVVLGLQIGFWGTPIFWDISVMPPKVQFILKFNPMYYIVQG